MPTGIVEVWSFMSRFEDVLELPRVPSIPEIELAFAGPHQNKSPTTAVVVRQSCFGDNVISANHWSVLFATEDIPP